MTKWNREGVNIGGWLLVERWLTPSLFKGTEAKDEYELLLTKDGAERIRNHRATFITEEDWQWLSNHGITIVRLPVGYWALQSDAPFLNAKKELDWAFAMAEKYGVQILLDLHGLKGSQNGHMHSGRAGAVNWRTYEAQHLRTLQKLARQYRNSPSLWGVEIINEPKVVGQYWALVRYYRKAYALLCEELAPGTHVLFQDGFVPPLFSGVVRARNSFPVSMDTHFYLLPGAKLFERMHPRTYDRVRGWIYGAIIWACRIQQPVVVGEWGSVLPQTMFDAIPKSKHLALLGETIARQRHMYRKAQLTFYWNYKAEGRGMYHYRSLIEDKVVK